MKTPFAEAEGRFYVKVRASGIHPLIPYTDGMMIAYFRKSGQPYLRLDEAIEWHEKELERSGGKSGDKKVMERLKRARESLTAKAQRDRSS